MGFLLGSFLGANQFWHFVAFVSFFLFSVELVNCSFRFRTAFVSYFIALIKEVCAFSAHRLMFDQRIKLVINYTYRSIHGIVVAILVG